MTQRAADDWSNYWTGRAASEAGAALVGAGIETDAALQAIWAGALAGHGAAGPVLDLACGGGSALRAAARAGHRNLTGLDISPDAIGVLMRDMPGVRGVIAPANQTGLPDAQFGLVLSQFGFEYAGALAAAREAARLIAPGGAFIALAHLADGGIARECRRNLERLDALGESAFIPLALSMFRAVSAAEATGEPAAMAEARRAIEAFRPVADRVRVLSAEHGAASLTAHLLGGTARLFERRSAYALGDIEAWLAGMEREIAAYRGRMQGMLGAALDETGAHAVLAVFSEMGFASEPPRRIALGAAGEPAAWLLKAVSLRQPLA